MLSSRGDIVDNGVMSRSNSFSAPSLKNFVPFEDAMPATIATDAKATGAMFDTTAQATQVYDTGSNDNNRAWGQDGPQVGVVLQQTPVSPISNDACFIICAEAVADPDQTLGADQGGYIHFELIGTNGTIEIFPYWARFTTVGAVPAVSVPTDVYCPGRHRVPGSTYLFAAVKRGDLLDHWYLGPDDDTAIMTGSVNIVEALVAAGEPLSRWRSLQLSSGLGSGESCHCRSDPSGRCLDVGANSWHQIFYGWQWIVFEDGIPDSLGIGLAWTRDEWVNNPQGQKTFYPGWSALL